MRLCSKTEEISTSSVQSFMPNPGMSFCRIKSFRSHGAERKNANDMAIADKRIRRLKQQLVQSQTRQTAKDKKFGRDKSKTPKIPGARTNHQGGLLCKIKNLQQNCTSTQPYTFLEQQSEKQQDYDWPPSPHKDETPESPEAWSTLSPLAPRSGSMPMTSGPKSAISPSQLIQSPTPPWYDESQQRTSTRNLPERIKNRPGVIKVACFYIRPVGFNHISLNDHYIAVYLSERTACELTRRIAEAVLVDSSRVGQTTWSTIKGLTILVDDDVVANMTEGQDMQVEAKTTAPRSYSRIQSSNDSAYKESFREHGGSEDARELLNFNLVF